MNLIYAICLLSSLIFSVAPGFDPVSIETFYYLFFLSLGGILSLIILRPYLPNINCVNSFDNNKLTYLITLTEILMLFSISLLIFRLINFIDLSNLSNYRDNIFYRSKDDSGIFYQSGVESLLMNGLKTFCLVVLVMAKAVKKRFWILLLLFSIDSLIKLERGFIVTLILNILVIDILIEKNNIKKIIKTLFFGAIFSVLVYLIVNLLRGDGRNPLVAFIESYLIAPRLFEYIYSNYQENFFSFGFFTIAEFFSPFIHFYSKLFNEFYVRDVLNVFLDEFHCISIYRDSECLFYNAYFGGYLYFFRDFYLLGGFIGIFWNLMLMIFLIKITRIGINNNIFIISLLNVTFLRFTLIPAFNFQDFYLPIFYFIFFSMLINLINDNA